MSTGKTGYGRRHAVAFVAAVAAAGMLSACAGSSGGSAGKGAQPDAKPTGTLNIVVSSAPGSDAGFKAVNAAFHAKYPGVKVVFSSIPNQNYNSVKASRLSAGKVDIGIMDPMQVPSYVPKDNESDDTRLAQAGGLVDLTKMPFMKAFTPSVLDAIKFNGKDYTVPTGLSYYTGVFYNKAIFAKYHLSIPTTWSQFVALCQTLKSHGVTPLGIGGKDSWPAGLNMISAVQGLYPTAQDQADLQKALWTKQVKLTDARPEQILQRTKTMYDFAQKNFAGVPYSSIPSGFVKGQFAMTVDGTWDQTTIASAAGAGFSYGYFPVPTGDTAQDNAYLGGKVELMLGVPSNAKNPGAALAYLKFFSEPANYQTFVKAAGFAPSEPNISLNPFLTSIQPYTKVFSPAWDFTWHANSKAGPKAAFPFDYPDIAPLGGSTPAQAAALAQKDWAAGF
jgi:raffinose/stachyose/melibiose transport system substrate-binding protein